MLKAPERNESSSHQFAFLTKVTYGGPLGKLFALGALFFGMLCLLIGASWGHVYLLAGILVTGFVALIFLALRMEAIFRGNPEMATLEGKEILAYRQQELKFKNTEPVRVIEIKTESEVLETTHGMLAGELCAKEGE